MGHSVRSGLHFLTLVANPQVDSVCRLHAVCLKKEPAQGGLNTQEEKAAFSPDAGGLRGSGRDYGVTGGVVWAPFMSCCNAATSAPPSPGAVAMIASATLPTIA